ncbi:hypothetical protein [Caballeronia ptereochthonis]|uniref:DUF4440 domain-containing protein n=1 Tax=Caballeronia ptereochthonis TaxID=1777144 RepID=A0A158E3F5_9BURK|nr:hypothetical protein [Caballeronia ptereochthonis]SAL01303.1 hypothetical protein AWB83_06384 [Caballeronia ptereochthonis]
MRLTGILTGLAVAAALAIPGAAFAQSDQEVDARMDALVGAHEPYRAFFDRLQHAVAAGDRNAVADMVSYPITVRAAGRKTTLRSKRDFVARYQSIFTPKLVDTVARQKYATLFVRDQGAMIGDGGIWFSGVCRDEACKRSDVRITAFNLG